MQEHLVPGRKAVSPPLCTLLSLAGSLVSSDRQHALATLEAPPQNLVCSWYSLKRFAVVGSDRRQGESKGREKPSAEEHIKPESRLLLQCLW